MGSRCNLAKHVVSEISSSRQVATRPPAFQFYPRQFSGDDQVMTMDLEETGAHIRLMCAASASSEGYRIPADERAIRMCIGNPSDEQFEKIKTRLLAGAWKLRDGFWEQDGLRRTFEKQKAFSAAQRDRANSRWGSNHAEAMPDCTEPHESGTDKTDAQRCSAFASASAIQDQERDAGAHTPENLSIETKKPKPETKRFVKPTVQQIADFCKAAGITNIDAEDFILSNESKGWMIGRSPMKSWQASVRRWSRTGGNLNKSYAPQSASSTPAPASRNLSEEIEKAQRKLAASGYTRNLTVELHNLKLKAKAKMSPDEWGKWIAPLAGGCGGRDTLICLAPSEEHADHVVDQYAMLLGELAAEMKFENFKVKGL